MRKKQSVLQSPPSVDDWLDFFLYDSPEARIRKRGTKWLPQNKEQFERVIRNAPSNILGALDFVHYKSVAYPFRRWKKQVEPLVEDGRELMLYPTSWYNVIPKGFTIISIKGKLTSFDPGSTDPDSRMGCLGFGTAAVLPYVFPKDDS